MTLGSRSAWATWQNSVSKNKCINACFGSQFCESMAHSVALKSLARQHTMAEAHDSRTGLKLSACLDFWGGQSVLLNEVLGGKQLPWSSDERYRPDC